MNHTQEKAGSHSSRTTLMKNGKETASERGDTKFATHQQPAVAHLKQQHSLRRSQATPSSTRDSSAARSRAFKAAAFTSSLLVYIDALICISRFLCVPGVLMLMRAPSCPLLGRLKCSPSCSSRRRNSIRNSQPPPEISVTTVPGGDMVP